MVLRHRAPRARRAGGAADSRGACRLDRRRRLAGGHRVDRAGRPARDPAGRLGAAARLAEGAAAAGRGACPGARLAAAPVPADRAREHGRVCGAVPGVPRGAGGAGGERAGAAADRGGEHGGEPAADVRRAGAGRRRPAPVPRAHRVRRGARADLGSAGGPALLQPGRRGPGAGGGEPRGDAAAVRAVPGLGVRGASVGGAGFKGARVGGAGVGGAGVGGTGVGAPASEAPWGPAPEPVMSDVMFDQSTGSTR